MCPACWLIRDSQRTMSGYARAYQIPELRECAIARIIHEGLDVGLRVVQIIGSHLVQLRKPLALDAEAFVVRKVKMQNVQLHRRHPIYVPLEHIKRNEVTTNINQ